ncbi:hypothetical protein ACHAP5_002069 [Fusarium lateritium]
MDSLHFIDQSAELDSISLSFQAAFDWLLKTTQDVRKGPLLRVAQKPDIPRLKEISTPRNAHPVQDATEDAFTISDFRLRMNHPRCFSFVPSPVSLLGVERLGQMIDHGFHLAEVAEAEVQKLSNWEITSQASMAIVTFRYAPGGKTEEELDELNGGISRHFMENNIAGILTTKLGGRVVLRICSISPVLSAEEMVEVVMQLDQVAKSVLQGQNE